MPICKPRVRKLNNPVTAHSITGCVLINRFRTVPDLCPETAVTPRNIDDNHPMLKSYNESRVEAGWIASIRLEQ